MNAPTTVRVDKWLWAVRATKTRTVANDACSSGKVRVNDEPAKPATKLKVGDRVQLRGGGHVRIYEVARLIEKRVGAAIAAECYIDHSPIPEPADPLSGLTHGGPAASIDPGRRDRGSGRPTKRDRRQIDGLRQRDR
ncbi:MAG: RNA-binding S4 domain-containing protein [Acidimicrobiales bacterium]